MAGYYGEENFTGPLEPPVRITGERPYDTQTLEPPVRITGERRGGGGGDGALSAGYYPPTIAPEASSYVGGVPIPDRSSRQTPIMNSTLETHGGSNSGCMPRHLVITSLVLRTLAVVFLIVGLAVLASMSYTLINMDTLIQYTYNYSSFSSTRYALAAAITGAAYSIYETVSVAVRLAMGHPLLPGDVSLFISYIGDQVIIVLVLTGASAAAATFKDLHNIQIVNGTSYCDMLGDLCRQGVAGIVMMFLGFCFLAASLVISSLCFYKRKT